MICVIIHICFSGTERLLKTFQINVWGYGNEFQTIGIIFRTIGKQYEIRTFHYAISAISMNMRKSIEHYYGRIGLLNGSTSFYLTRCCWRTHSILYAKTKMLERKKKNEKWRKLIFHYELEKHRGNNVKKMSHSRLHFRNICYYIFIGHSISKVI